MAGRCRCGRRVGCCTLWRRKHCFEALAETETLMIDPFEFTKTAEPPLFDDVAPSVPEDELTADIRRMVRYWLRYEGWLIPYIRSLLKEIERLRNGKG